MIEIDFRYKRKSYIIKCSINDILKNICQDFAQKNSLDFDEILFTYKGRKLNLDLNLSIKQQFNLDDNGDIIRKKIFVYNQTSICIHFFLIPSPNSEPDIINCKKSDKLLDILLKYIAEKGLKKENLQFLYQAEELIDVNDKTVGELITKNDKSEGIMTIMVRDYVGISRSNSIISQDKVVFRADPPPMDEKHFYLRISKILGVQYIYIILFTTIGIFCEINKIFMNDDVHIIFKILPILLFIFSLSFLLEKYIQNNKSSNYMIIIHTSYTIFIIYYCLLISVYLEYKYIIIGLCLILLEVLSLGIYVLIFKVYKFLYFCIASFSLSLLGHILFSTLWVQSLLPIVYVSIFYFLTNIYFVLTIYISKSENEEYYYPVIIFEYGIFLGLEYGIKNAVIFIYDYITGNLDELDIAKEKAKIFVILLIQYTIIIIVVWITFAAIGKESVSLGTFHALFWICTVINLIICIVIVCNGLKPSDSRGYYFCSIIYVPIMISYYIAFSYAINKEQILSFLFIIFFDLLSIVILILVFKTDHCGFVFIACIIPSIISVICYHFCWFHKHTILTNISVIASFIIIYIVVGFLIIKRMPDGSDEYYEDYYIFSVVLFDYGFFGVIFAITFGIIALIIAIIGYICENCKS